MPLAAAMILIKEAQMSISNAKHYAHLAKYSSNSDAQKLENLVTAVYDLARAVEDLEQEIKRVKRDVRDL
jgi:outer membrane murein-binding lipoprotein Lpp